MKDSAAPHVCEPPRCAGEQALNTTSKCIWIDLDNSPHVPFFAPIIDRLRERGYRVLLTARDAYQVRELADLFGFSYICIGGHWGKHWVLKAFGTCLRAVRLLPIVWKEKPALAVAHGSRSQTIASVLLGIPSLVIFDYEFTSSVAFFKPTWRMTPEVIPLQESEGGNPVLRYPGIKEDVYVPSFKADPSVKARMPIDDEHIMVLLRPPASEAHYHNPKSDELFAATIQFLARTPDVRVIILPRNNKQKVSVEKAWPDLFAAGVLYIPDHAEDGLNLIWHSDLVISGGGTMNREAAALGVPVYSIFRGKIGAVDRYLADQARLVLVESADEIRTKIRLCKRVRRAAAEGSERQALMTIVNDIVALVSRS